MSTNRKKEQNGLFDQIASSYGQVAVLIDPEKTHSEEQIRPLVEKAEFAGVNYFFVGGSTASRKELEQAVHCLKKHTNIPCLLFPGSSNQLSPEADGLLYLSLVSGRNPDYLISHHVNSAQEVFQLGIEILPTGYILVDGGTKSSVAYVSQTTPIPREQVGIALNTALAAIMQGKKLIYFDAGSGAKEEVPVRFIESLRNYSDVPIIVGGGIRNIGSMENLQKAGVNVLVIGNKLEEEIDFLLDIRSFIQQ
ncbi:MAG: phosphoglycerol geranylgeranyltransferase [Bacteroidetes bacterium]|nr:MAG: phosphoglycerol geranylgeranyltransferase [Bacteroidota bacterium]